MSERKEWVKVAHAANGKTSVTVTIQEGNLSAKWALPCFTTNIKDAVIEARRFAETALDQLREAVS